MNDSAKFTPALRSWFLETCREYGFSTVGVHNALATLNQPTPAVPYLQPIVFLDIPHWRPVVPDADFQDVFAPRASRIGFPRRLRNLGPEAPGKQAYVRTMRKLYRDRIEDFNTTYGTTFQSFDVLAAAVRHKKPVPCGFGWRTYSRRPRPRALQQASWQGGVRGTGRPSHAG